MNSKNKNLTEIKKNSWPATLYVEGQDQFRGWFNSSLITSTILTNNPPYKQVVAHGFVVDEKGRKMSKSLGNVISPEEIIEKFGIDVVRLWVAGTDFTKEIKISIPLLQEIQGNYQKIRNTCRFLLGNLSTLTSENQLVKKLEPVDEWILAKLDKLTVYSQENYQKYNFNLIYQAILNYCINDLSSFYFEISKDSLYCDSLENPRRKQIITVLYYLLGGLLKIISPIMPFLAEEVYENIPFKFGYAQEESVMFLPDSRFTLLSGEQNLKLIEDFLLLRQDVFSVLEKARQEKIITTNSQVNLKIYLKEKNKWNYSELNLEELLLVSEVEINEKEETDIWEGNFCSVKVKKTDKEKCIRCWNYRELVNNLCLRCKNTLHIWQQKS